MSINRVPILFSILFSISVPNETKSATGQNCSSGQLTEVIKSWLISFSGYQRVEIVGYTTLGPGRSSRQNCCWDKIFSQISVSGRI